MLEVKEAVQVQNQTEIGFCGSFSVVISDLSALAVVENVTDNKKTDLTAARL
jgi:hypothetical protein